MGYDCIYVFSCTITLIMHSSVTNHAVKQLRPLFQGLYLVLSITCHQLNIRLDSIHVIFYYNCPDVSCSSSLFCWICTVVLNIRIVPLSSKILLFPEVNWSCSLLCCVCTGVVYIRIVSLWSEITLFSEVSWRLLGLYKNCLPLLRNYPLFGSQLKIVGFYIIIVSLCSEITLFS
jgi:hypothetical protein